MVTPAKGDALLRTETAQVLPPDQPVAALQGVTKSFGGTVAVRDVSVALHAGEVLALLGENGAGKSTCVKLLAGVYRPDAGEVVLDGQPVQLAAPLDAQRHGIAVMHQHPGLFPDLSVAENIAIGHGTAARLGLLDRARMREDADRLLAMVGWAVVRRRGSAGCAAPSSSWSRSPARCQCALGS